MKSYSYQYETSPRKLNNDYKSPKKPTNRNTKKKSSKTQVKSNANKKKQITKKQIDKKEKNKTTKKKEQKEAKSSSNIKTKVAIFVKCFLIFAIFFLTIYRNSLITQSFAEIQKLKTSITELQKENNQLEINIQNSLNTNNIAQAAKELLGMQKLTNKQIVYISLSKKDYVEPRTEEVKLEEDKTFIESIIEKIKNLF